MAVNSTGRDDSGQATDSDPDNESSLAALARELVDKVGLEGAMRYCHSLGWRGVLDEVAVLRARAAGAD